MSEHLDLLAASPTPEDIHPMGARLAIFPLHTVLYPGGPLPLRIFEPRYTDMVSHCLKEGRGFGVCLIRSGKEVGEAAIPYDLGTQAIIVDWHMRHDGLLGLTTHGEQRFRIRSSEVLPNQLIMAEVDFIANEPSRDVPPEYLPMVDVLRYMIDAVGHHYASIPKRFGDASWVSCRLAELLPLRLAQKQYLLQLHDPVQRLERLWVLMEELGIKGG